MQPEIQDHTGVQAWMLDGPAEAEQLAAALEETAARVRDTARRCGPDRPPALSVLHWETEDHHDEVNGMVMNRCPLVRAFVVRWPEP